MQMHNVQLRYPHSGWRQRLDNYFAELGLGINPGPLIRARMGEVAGLEALSDEELSIIGLRRRDIPARVFADMFGS